MRAHSLTHFGATKYGKGVSKLLNLCLWHFNFTFAWISRYYCNYVKQGQETSELLPKVLVQRPKNGIWKLSTVFPTQDSCEYAL